MERLSAWRARLWTRAQPTDCEYRDKNSQAVFGILRALEGASDVFEGSEGNNFVGLALVVV